MAKVELDSILQMDHLADDNRLNAVLKNGIKRMLGPDGLNQEEVPLWTPEYFNLPNTRAFQSANQETQEKIITRCSQSLLEEALFIEQSGLAFGAKMALLSETVEERMLYGLFMGDETTHYQQVRRFLPNLGQDCQPSSFHQLLTQVIEDGERETLVFIIQVVLEGWGLTHYKSLADGCQNPQFEEALRGILRDESRHHGSGVILARERGLPSHARDFTLEVLSKFLGMVQYGPQSVVEAIVQENGGLTRAQKIEIFEELDTVAHSQERLNLLRSLMEQDGFSEIVSDLDAHHLFDAKPAGECA